MQWEYKILESAMKGFWSKKIDGGAVIAQLNNLGEQGWELVSSFDSSKYQGASSGIVFVFKRPKKP